MSSVISEFVVALGFQANMPQFAAFQKVLGQAQGTAESTTSILGSLLKQSNNTTVNAALAAGKAMTGMVEGLVKWQTIIVGFFDTIATGALGIADKVAMADQGFRLFSQRMLLTQEAGKRLKTTLDALGEPIEVIAWDKELRERAIQLDEDQKQMEAGLGGNFEDQMRNIRDLRFELTRLKVEAEYVIQALVSGIFGHFGLTFDDVLKRFKAFNDWITSHIPEISAKFQKYLVPILNDTWDVLKNIGTMLKDVGELFVNIVGLFSNDESLKGTGLTFDKIATAIQHVVHWMADFVNAITQAEEVVLHFANGAVLALSHNFVGAAIEIRKGLTALTAGSGGILGAVGGAAVGAGTGAVTGGLIGAPAGPLGIAAGAAVGGTVGGIAGAFQGGIVGSIVGKINSMFHGGSGGAGEKVSNLSELISAASQKYGVDPNLLKAVISAESGGRNAPENSKHAAGVMQLLPGTASDLGVVDRMDPAQNIMGGAKYLSQLLARYHGDTTKALGAYNWGMKYMDEGRTDLPPETRNYITKIMRDVDGSKATAGQASGGDNFNVNVNVNQSNATPEHIRGAVKSGIRDAFAQQSQRDLLMIPG